MTIYIEKIAEVAGSYISVFCSRDDGYPVGQINAGNTFLTLVLVGSYWV